MMPRIPRTVAVAIMVAACGSDDIACVTPPCALSMAVTAMVTSGSSSTPLPAGVFLTFTINGSSGSGFCSTGTTVTCELPGGGGTYQIAIGAPGFQTQSRTANVTQPQPQKCGCTLAQTQHFDIVLTPATTAIGYQHS